MREILTCKWEKPSIYRTGVGSKEWSTGCHRGEIWYVSVVEIGNHDGQYTEATLSQNKIYIYITIKLKNSQNFNQKIVQQSFIYTKYHLYKKYLHISSIKLKDHTNFNQKIILFRFFLAHKIFIYSQFFDYWKNIYSFIKKNILYQI